MSIVIPHMPNTQQPISNTPLGVQHATPGGPQTQAGNDMAQNFARQQSGLGAMSPEEQQREEQRFSDKQVQNAQMEQLNTILDDRVQDANLMADKLTAAGLADVGENLRRTAQRQSFNAARRGIAGGSAAIEQQEAARADAGQQAGQVQAASGAALAQEILKAQQSRDRLAGQILSTDKYREQQENNQSRKVSDSAQGQIDLLGIQGQQQQLGNAFQSVLGGILGNTIGNYGQGAGDAIEARG